MNKLKSFVLLSLATPALPGCTESSPIGVCNLKLMGYATTVGEGTEIQRTIACLMLLQ